MKWLFSANPACKLTDLFKALTQRMKEKYAVLDEMCHQLAQAC